MSIKLKTASRALRPLLALALSVVPFSAAQASAFPILLPHIGAFVVTSSSQCITYTYDENGNRTAVAVIAIATSATVWGSGKYGCFVWHS